MSEERLPAVPGEDRLTERQETILRTVVEEHIGSGIPVGSKHIAGREGIDFAASTVRYELARLEELGYLNHPHTSAGRVPTDRGYRYYVDNLVTRDPQLQAPAVLESALDLGEVQREVDAALGRLADVVAQVTNLLGIVTAPAPADLVGAPRGGAAAAAPGGDGGGDHLHRAPSPSGCSPSTGRWTWACASGPAPSSTTASWAWRVGSRQIDVRLDDASLSPAERAFLSVLAPAVTDLDDGAESIFVGGRARFLAEQRHLDLMAIDALMESLEERYALLAMLRGALSRNQVYLRIGAELPDQSLAGLSMVAANYGIPRRNLGTVSLFGPDPHGLPPRDVDRARGGPDPLALRGGRLRVRVRAVRRAPAASARTHYPGPSAAWRDGHE